MSDDAHFRLRIPRDLKEWVEENAKKNNRSINAEVISCLEHVRDLRGQIKDLKGQKNSNHSAIISKIVQIGLEVLVDEAIRRKL